MYEIFLKLLQKYPFFAIFVVKRPEKAQFPECLMNVVKMLDGRRKMEDVTFRNILYCYTVTSGDTFPDSDL